MRRPALFAALLGLAACGGKAFTTAPGTAADALEVLDAGDAAQVLEELDAAPPEASPELDAGDAAQVLEDLDAAPPEASPEADAGELADVDAGDALAQVDAPLELEAAAADAPAEAAPPPPPVDAGPLCCASSCSATPLPCGVGSTNCATHLLGATCGAVNGSCFAPGRVVACN